jgi:hypothetical protein
VLHAGWTGGKVCMIIRSVNEDEGREDGRRETTVQRSCAVQSVQLPVSAVQCKAVQPGGGWGGGGLGVTMYVQDSSQVVDTSHRMALQARYGSK